MLELHYRVRVDGLEVARFTDPNDAQSLTNAQLVAGQYAGDVKIDQYTPCCGWRDITAQ